MSSPFGRCGFRCCCETRKDYALFSVFRLLNCCTQIHGKGSDQSSNMRSYSLVCWLLSLTLELGDRSTISRNICMNILGWGGVRLYYFCDRWLIRFGLEFFCLSSSMQYAMFQRESCGINKFDRIESNQIEVWHLHGVQYIMPNFGDSRLLNLSQILFNLRNSTLK